MLRQLCRYLSADLVAARSDTWTKCSPFGWHSCGRHGLQQSGHDSRDDPTPPRMGNPNRCLGDQRHSQAVGSEYCEGKAGPGREQGVRITMVERRFCTNDHPAVNLIGYCPLPGDSQPGGNCCALSRIAADISFGRRGERDTRIPG